MPLRPPAGFIRPGFDPLKNPNAPTIGTASPVSDTSLSIAFTAPSNVGGSAITSYIATAKRTSDGVTFSATGASSPITVTGLSSVPFTVTVVAVNSYGPSASSAASNSVTPVVPLPTVIGQAYGGGFYAGQIGFSSVATHYLIVGPVSTAQSTLVWKTPATATAGADSNIDGPQNTADMVAAGNSSVYPSAHFCNDLSIGGQTDWYMPAKNELEVCYYNLKPTNSVNTGSSGVNPNAVPARASNYTSGTPAQTSATNFRSAGSERFSSDPYYWCSTEYSTVGAVSKGFEDGADGASYKTYSRLVRAVRRVPV